jgi:hypothetical protein
MSVQQLACKFIFLGGGYAGYSQETTGFFCLYSTKYTLMLSILGFGFGSVKQPGIKPTI